MDDSCVALSVYGVSGSGTGIYPWCVSWCFGVHSLWQDALLSLDEEGRGLVLPQHDIPGFLDSMGDLTLSEE